MNLTKFISYLLLVQLVLAQDGQNDPGPELKTYVIIFKDGDDPTERAKGLAKAHGGSVKNVYTHVLKGAALTIPVRAAAALASNPHVTSMEEDQVVTISAPATIYSYGQSRVDQCPGGNLGAVGTDTFNRMDAATVRVYILDTGIYGTHNDFSGLIGPADCHKTEFPTEPALSDGNGHGTHVASTVCGIKYGVVTCKELCAVKVLANSGSGSFSGVIAGIDFVAANCNADGSGRKCVANMSLGGGAYSPVDTAVNNAVAMGVTFVVSAGNDNADACNNSPARATNAITVGAIGSNDAPASFTNYGSCVDIYAPGVSITAAWRGSNTATNTISGTSMASPHVCALAAAARQMGFTDVAGYLKVRASKKTIDCRSEGTGVAVNPDIDCSLTLSTSCSTTTTATTAATTAATPSTCRTAGQQCKKKNCGSWTGCAGTGTSCCCCSGLSCGGSGTTGTCQ